jgi:hypothetical protein
MAASIAAMAYDAPIGLASSSKIHSLVERRRADSTAAEDFYGLAE